MMKKLLSISQAAEETGLSEYELRQGAKSGKYPAMRAGGPKGKILFDVELLEQAITQIMLSNALLTTENHSGIIRSVRITK